MSEWRSCYDDIGGRFSEASETPSIVSPPTADVNIGFAEDRDVELSSIFHDRFPSHS